MSIRKGSRTIASSVPVTEWGSVDGTLTDQADLKNALDSKAEKYSPTFTGTPLAPTAPVGTSNNQIATTKYVQDALLNAGSDLPDQTGQSGKFLTTNGTLPSWVGISQVPSQSGQSGKFLTTNGTTASWAGAVTLDTTQTITGSKTFENTDSSNAVTTAFIIKSDNQTLGTNPQTNHVNSIDFKDSNNTTVTKFSSIQTSDGWYGFLAGTGSDPTNPQNNLLMIASGNNKLLLIPPTTSHSSCAVRRDFFNTEFAKTVKNTGDESIAGSKTFTSRMWTTVDDTNPIAIKDTVLGVWETPSTDRHRYIGILDKGNNLISYIHAYKTISGVQHIYLQTTNSDNSSTIYSEKIGLKISNTGVVTTYAPTPPASDNSTQIATTAWVSTNIKLNAGTNISIDSNKNINYTGPRYYRLATRTWTYAQWTQYCERGVTTNVSPSFTVTGIRAGDLVSVEGICSDRGNANVLAWGIAQGEAAAETGNVSVTFLGLNIQEDNILVHTINAETIAGNKTFTSKQIMLVTGNDIITNEIKDDTVAVGSAPEAQRVRRIRFTDKDGVRIGELQSVKSTAGVQTVAILASNAISGTTVNASLLVGVDSSGNSYATCPTPPENSNNTKIATTAWVNTKLTSAYIPNYTSPTTASTSYSPTANGTLHAFVSGGGCWVQIAQGSHVLARSQTTDSTSGQQCVWIIAKKGQTYTVTASATPTVTFYPFG